MLCNSHTKIAFGILTLLAGRQFIGMAPSQKVGAAAPLYTRVEPKFADEGSREWHMIQACKNGDTALAQELLAKYPDLDVNAYDSDHETALLKVAALPGLDAIKVANSLYERGADVNEFGKNDRTPLMIAAKEHNIGMVSWLVKHRAFTNHYDAMCWTALLLAIANNGNLDIVSCLVEHGADVNAVGISGFTTLGFAAHWGNPKIIAYLVKHGADVTMRDSFGRTPLAWAAQRGNVAAVIYLIQAHADIHMRNENDKTTLQIAQIARENCMAEYKQSQKELALWSAPRILPQPSPSEQIEAECKQRKAKIECYDAIVSRLEAECIAQPIKHALLACDELIHPSQDDFPPELIDRVLKPLITATQVDQ